MKSLISLFYSYRLVTQSGKILYVVVGDVLRLSNGEFIVIDTVIDEHNCLYSFRDSLVQSRRNVPWEEVTLFN